MRTNPLDPLAVAFHRLSRAYFWLRRPLTVGVRALVEEGGRVLLVRHTYRAGWYLPGGGVERGESLESAVRRELLEETGVAFEGPPVLLGAYSNFRDYKCDHIVLFRIPAWHAARAPALPNREIAEIGFFDRDALPEGTSPATLRRLAEASGAAPAAFLW